MSTCLLPWNVQVSVFSSTSQFQNYRSGILTCTAAQSTAAKVRRQCFAKCPFTCQFDRLAGKLCQSLDRLSDYFAKHCVPQGTKPYPHMLPHPADTSSMKP